MVQEKKVAASMDIHSQIGQAAVSQMVCMEEKQHYQHDKDLPTSGTYSASPPIWLQIMDIAQSGPKQT